MAMQSDQEFAPTQIARAVFPTAFRGYDQDAVRRYLSRLAAALEHQQEYAGLGELEARTPAHERVEELESELEGLRGEIRDLELELVQRSVEGDVVEPESTPGAHDASDSTKSEKQPESEREDRAFDEHRAIELLGKETARVLESARSAAADILKRAETQAASLRAEASAELEDAKRSAEALVAEKQAASDELVAKLASEAEATAERISSEAEEHRLAVLEESSKILTEAEELAEAEQEDAEGRAKQIVADAETLRQQIVSELVAERRQAQAEMDTMTSARDRLAMSLAVARTELDEVADALIDVTNISIDASPVEQASDEAGDEKTPAAEAEDLIGTLDRDLEASPAQNKSSGKGQNRNKRGKRRKSRATGAKSESSPKSGSGADAKPPAGPSKKPVGSSFDTGSARFEQIKQDGASEEVVTGSALLMDDAAGEDSPPETSIETSTETAIQPDEKTGAGEVTAATEAIEDTADPDRTVQEAALREAVDPDEPIDLDKIIEMGLAAEVIGPETADDSATTTDLNTPPADGEELSLVQGFTTIDLTDGEEIDLTTAASDSAADTGTDTDAQGDGEGVNADPRTDDGNQLVNPSVPEEMITTVSSRTTSGQPDRTRGDLLIEEPFTGRLAKEFAARDLALTRSGPNFRRQLRRALNDDQSDVLDRLRSGRGDIKVDELPAFGEQIDRYLAPLRRGLAEIAQAGATAGGQSELSQTALDNLVRQLARYIVDKVRMPTVAVLEETTHQDRERILEPIRSLYRDFRNVGMPDLTEDALYEAFAIGLYDSIEPSAPISWVVDPRSDPDPVCEINRQRDDVVKGVVFPSGHARPLSLPGCRCLVLLADY